MTYEYKNCFIADLTKISSAETRFIKCNRDGDCPKLNRTSLNCLEFKTVKKVCIHDPAILCKCQDDCPVLTNCVDLLHYLDFGICLPRSNTPIKRKAINTGNIKKPRWVNESYESLIITCI